MKPGSEERRYMAGSEADINTEDKGIEDVSQNIDIDDAARTWAYALCECAGETPEYAGVFYDRIRNSLGIYDEYKYYMIHQNFRCAYSIKGISIVDILVWQIDHFKAGMDTLRPEKENPDRLLLTAFVTMLDMEDHPDELVRAYRHDTGTDYPGKF